MFGSFRTADIRNAEPLPVADREAARERALALLLIEDAAQAGDADRVRELALTL